MQDQPVQPNMNPQDPFDPSVQPNQPNPGQTVPNVRHAERSTVHKPAGRDETPVSMTNDAQEPVMTDSPDPMPNQMPEPSMESPAGTDANTAGINSNFTKHNLRKSWRSKYFYLLGVENGTRNRKKRSRRITASYLGRFLGNDAQLLLTKDEFSASANDRWWHENPWWSKKLWWFF